MIKLVCKLTSICEPKEPIQGEPCRGYSDRERCGVNGFCVVYPDLDYIKECVCSQGYENENKNDSNSQCIPKPYVSPAKQGVRISVDKSFYNITHRSEKIMQKEDLRFEKLSNRYYDEEYYTLIEKDLRKNNNLIKWTVRDEGEYEIYLESMSTNQDFEDDGKSQATKGPAMGVNIRLKMNLTSVK